MADWVKVGDDILNVDNIEYVERYILSYETVLRLRVHMGSGKVIEVTNTMALTLWNYLDSERLKFLDFNEPSKDFSGT